MSVVSDATIRAETEIASGPDVWFVLVQYEAHKDMRNDWWSQPLYRYSSRATLIGLGSGMMVTGST